MIATISFEDGSQLTVEKNADCYIVASKPAFPNPLGVVTIESEDGTRVFNDAQLIECASIDDRYWFAFGEESEYERTIRELLEENEILEGAIAELAEIIGGGE